LEKETKRRFFSGWKKQTWGEKGITCEKGKKLPSEKNEKIGEEKGGGVQEESQGAGTEKFFCGRVRKQKKRIIPQGY